MPNFCRGEYRELPLLTQFRRYLSFKGLAEGTINCYSSQAVTFLVELAVENGLAMLSEKLEGEAYELAQRGECLGQLKFLAGIAAGKHLDRPQRQGSACRRRRGGGRHVLRGGGAHVVLVSG